MSALSAAVMLLPLQACFLCCRAAGLLVAFAFAGIVLAASCSGVGFSNAASLLCLGAA
jgi:hypothetical protein